AEGVGREEVGKCGVREGRRYPGKTTWNERHLAWVRGQEFGEAAQRHVAADAVAAVEAATLRVAQLTATLREVTADWDRMPLVRALQALRGVEFVTAVTVAAEGGGLRRFPTAGGVLGFVGPVPTGQRGGESGGGGGRQQGWGWDEEEGEWPRGAAAGGIGVALSEAAADEQGVAAAERGASAERVRGRVEGARPAPQSDEEAAGAREAPGGGGDGG